MYGAQKRNSDRISSWGIQASPAYHVPLIDLDKVPTPTSSRCESEGDDGPAFVDAEAGEGRVTMTPIGLVQYRRREVPTKVLKCKFCHKKSKSEMIPFEISNY